MFISSSRYSVRVSFYHDFDFHAMAQATLVLVRMAAFTMRAVLAASDGAGQNSNLLIAEQVVFSVGYFGLLYSAYTLVLDR